MKAKLALLFLGILLITGWKQIPLNENSISEAGTVKVMIMYPNEEGKTFNMDYYNQKHMPMCAELFGEALQSYSIDKGLMGRIPSEPATYVAIGTFHFNQLSDYEKAFGPNAEKILADIPNYTNIQPVVQISEVVK